MCCLIAIQLQSFTSQGSCATTTDSESYFILQAGLQCNVRRVYVHDSLRQMALDMAAHGNNVAGWSLSRVTKDLAQARFRFSPFPVL